MPITPSDVRAMRDRLALEQQRRVLRPIPTVEEQARLEEQRQQAERQQPARQPSPPEQSYLQGVAGRALGAVKRKAPSWIDGKK